jgi:hypothetical protein|nr:hypothetical protein [uncultured Steroidobacter sp.]
MKALRLLIGGALLMAASVSAHAYTECTGQVTRIFTDSTVYVWFDTGLNWQKSPYYITSPPTPGELERQQAVKNLLAMVTTGMTTGRSVTVRFSADGVSCTGDQTNLEVWGVFLNAT